MPFNTSGQNDALSGGIGNAITHIGVNTLVTAPPTDTTPGTGATAAATEAIGGSPAYARLAVTWAAAASGQRSNSGALTFDVPAGTYGFLTFWTALTGNSGTQYRGWAPINGSVKGFFSVDTTLANDALFSVAHGLADGDRVLLMNVFAESLPTGLTEGAAYYVVNSTANSFKVSNSLGGAAVDISAVGGGEGFFQKVIPEVFGAQGQITVAAGALVLDATGI
ncbi:hypothetical protein ETD86_34825 [Nonomuraea turkmeniaca]|uniref:Uncharacterized protein n=1 Tax=Nonomuraea turkmeniaca TaxID=103838 RepID=A0A5S4F6E5_9ACTN|nr:hypothetical protein [Nonomuraea turkmeniaca]TMR11745.1 hypothetical protein ETD86_34825 [Nonomuraea turkmeniaca]